MLGARRERPPATLACAPGLTERVANRLDGAVGDAHTHPCPQLTTCMNSGMYPGDA